MPFTQYEERRVEQAQYCKSLSTTPDVHSSVTLQDIYRKHILHNPQLASHRTRGLLLTTTLPARAATGLPVNLVAKNHQSVKP